MMPRIVLAFFLLSALILAAPAHAEPYLALLEGY